MQWEGNIHSAIRKTHPLLSTNPIETRFVQMIQNGVLNIIIYLYLASYKQDNTSIHIILYCNTIYINKLLHYVAIKLLCKSIEF